MPSKDIFSIRQFQITHQQSQLELYQRAYALPEFFTSNLVHENRVVKIFTGQNALIKAFYFNYMKLALQSQDSQEYLYLLKEQFLSYDHIKQGQLQDKFLSDFQYRKFFKDFIEIAKQKIQPDFQSTAKKYPIIDQVLEKLFKIVVSIEQLKPQISQQKISEFEIANQIIQKLCEKFEESFSISIAQKCLKFQQTEMYLYLQSMNEVYIAYIDQQEVFNDRIHKFESSEASSFVCGEGNSFTSKFKGSNEGKTKKHPFRQINLQTSESDKGQKSIKNTQSFYLPQNGNSKKTVNTKIDGIFSQSNKMQVLQNKGSLIRRRSKNSQINKENNQFQVEKPNSFGDFQKQSLNVESSWQKHEQFKEKDLTNTLINILNLDSRGSIAEQDAIILPSALIQKAPQKCQLIMRRKSNKKSIEEPLAIKKDIFKIQNNFDPKNVYNSQIKDQKNDSDEPITIPEPKQLTNMKSPSIVSNYNMKAPQTQMQEIIQLGEDQDSEEMIRNFCQMQEKQHSVKTIHLTDSISRRLNIQQVQSRNINISRTSLTEEVETPYLKEPKSYQNFQNFQNLQPTISEQKKLNYPGKVYNNESQKKTFQEYMKQMRAKLQLRQKSPIQPIHKTQKMEFSFKKNTNNLTNNLKSQKIEPLIENITQNFSYQNYQTKESQPKQNLREYYSHELNWIPSGSDEFTKSNILLLLDEQYRQKIRAIKNEYKSTIKEQQSSLLKQNFRSAIDLKTKSLIKESQKRKTYNKNQQISVNYDFRQRQTSIHLQEY